MNIKSALSLSVVVFTAAFAAVSCGGKATTAPPAAPVATITQAPSSPPTPAPAVRSRQITPDWVNDTWRNAKYPQDEWFVGFSQNNVRQGAATATALKEVEKDAQSKMAENISVHVESASRSERYSHRTQDREALSIKYGQIIQTSTSAVIAKSEQYSWHDTENNRVYALAAVRKKDLAEYYRSHINRLFAFVDRELTVAEKAAEEKRKDFAPGRIHAVEDSLNRAGYWNFILLAVENDESFIEKDKALAIRLNDVTGALPLVTAIYFDVSGNKDYPDLAEQVAGKMLEKGSDYTLAAKKEDAGFIVSINAKPTRCEVNSTGLAFCYLNANVTMENLKIRKTVNVAIPEAKGGWKEGNKERAMMMAMREFVNSLADNIIKNLDK